MVERWKIDAARNLERLTNALVRLADELERYNDLREQELDDGRKDDTAGSGEGKL